MSLAAGFFEKVHAVPRFLDRVDEKPAMVVPSSQREFHGNTRVLVGTTGIPMRAPLIILVQTAFHPSIPLQV